MLDRKRANLHQSHAAKDGFPFYDLDPLFRDHPGAAYWKGGANLVVPQKIQKKKLAEIAAELTVRWQTTSEVAYRKLSNRVAIVQRLAYASRDASKLGSLPDKLPSCAETVALVKNLVAEDEKLIVIVRAAKAYGFTGPENNTEKLIVYKPLGEARGGHLTMASPAGPVIVERMLKRDLS